MPVSATIKEILISLAVGAVIVLGGWWAIHHYGETRYQAGVTAQVAADKEAVAQQEKLNREKEQQHAAELAAAQKENADQLAAAERGRAAADKSASSFRVQLNEVTRILNDSAAGADPAAKSAGPSARATALLLADVLGKSVERNKQLADYADRARIAGQLCERSHDAIAK